MGLDYFFIDESRKCDELAERMHRCFGNQDKVT